MLEIVHTTFSMTWLISKILIQIVFRKIKSYTKIIYYIGYITIKNLSYVKITSVNASYFIIDKADGYIEESNENKYLMLLSTDKNKDTFKKI